MENQKLYGNILSQCRMDLKEMILIDANIPRIDMKDINIFNKAVILGSYSSPAPN